MDRSASLEKKSQCKADPLEHVAPSLQANPSYKVSPFFSHTPSPVQGSSLQHHSSFSPNLYRILTRPQWHGLDWGMQMSSHLQFSKPQLPLASTLQLSRKANDVKTLNATWWAREVIPYILDHCNGGLHTCIQCDITQVMMQGMTAEFRLQISVADYRTSFQWPSLELNALHWTQLEWTLPI